MNALNKQLYRWVSQRFMEGCSSYNSLDVRKRCRSKKQARKVFAQGDIPHANGLIFINPLKAFAFAKAYGYFSSQVIGKPPIYTTYFSNVAVSGYNTVAYFTKSKVVKGNSKHSAKYQCAKWHFSSKENRDLFTSFSVRFTC